LIHFVLATGAPDSVSRLSAQLIRALNETRIFDGETIIRTGTTGTWTVAAICRPDPVCRVRVSAEDDSIVLVNGPAFARQGDQAHLIDRVLRAFRVAGTAGVATALCGTYNFVGADPAQGVRAFGDCSALYPLYWHDGTDVSVISNRSSTIASAVGLEGWDAHALAWIIGRANLFGESMPVQGVQHVQSGTEAQVDWGVGGIRLERSPEWIWPEPSNDGGRETLRAAEWDEVTDELVSNTRLLGNLEAPIRLALTGGKDSRLSLALAKAAGLQDAVVAYTSGGLSHPETESAVAVAAAAAFRHDATGADAMRPLGPHGNRRPAFDSQSEWHRLQRQVYRYEGIVPAWNDRSTWAKPETVTLEGFVGELYRNGHEPIFRRPHPITVDMYLSLFPLYHQAGRRAGVQLLRRGEETFQSQWIANWVRTTANDVRLDVLPDKFFVDNRLAHWTGPQLQNAAYVTINPLSSAFAARKVLELALGARTSEVFHLEVMRRTAPELIDIPLFRDHWAQAYSPHRAEAGSVIDHQPAAPGIHTLTRHRPIWSLLESDGDAIVELFEEADRHTAMAGICDMGKVIALARRSGELRDARARELFCCIGVAISMLGLARPVHDAGPIRDQEDAGADLSSREGLPERRSSTIGMGKASERDGRMTTATPDVSTVVARAAFTATHRNRFEQRLAATWRSLRRRIPLSSAEAIRVPAKKILRRLRVISRESRAGE
jgi:hypothetical protein